MFAVAITALLLVVWGAPEPSPAAAAPGVPTQAAAQSAASPTPAPAAEEDPAAAAEEAALTLRSLVRGFYAFLPKLGVAVLLLALAALLAKLSARLLRLLLPSWPRAEGLSALVVIAIWLLAFGAALSVIAGDARALVGSIGLTGLALSWALQTPIESFTGWLLNSFKGYYRVGDRIAVGDVFGDVYRIDVLTTMVWEAGGPGKPVQGAQPTGALITFPNLEILRSNVVNLTRDFPFVFDEVTVTAAPESDLSLALELARETARGVVGDAMSEPARRYAELLAHRNLGFEVPAEPQAFLSIEGGAAVITVRYLVAARERRRWASALLLELTAAFNRPELRGRIIAAIPRSRVEPTPHELR